MLISKLTKTHILYAIIIYGLYAPNCVAWFSPSNIPPHGVVVNGLTGSPIEKAYVIARFFGDGPYSFIDPGSVARNRCIGTLLTVTNEKGEFDFSNEKPSVLTSNELKRNLHIDVTAYALGFSHEINKGYQSWLNGDYVTEKYEKADGSAITLRLTPEADSDYLTRHQYLSRILLEFCGSSKKDTMLYWSMTQTIMTDMQEHAQTSQDWTQVYHFCNLLNKIKANGQLDVNEKHCDSYKSKIKQASERELKKIKNIISNIDWGDGPKLELIKYSIRQMNSGQSIFLVPNTPQGLDAHQLYSLLKKVCDSKYPGDFIFGTACFYFDTMPLDGGENTLCDAIGRSGHLDVNSGVAKGSTIKYETGWCREKKPPPYVWSQQ